MEKSSVLINKKLHSQMKHVAIERNVTVRFLYKELLLQFLSSIKNSSNKKEAV